MDPSNETWQEEPIVLIINVGDSFDSNTYTNETKLY